MGDFLEYLGKDHNWILDNLDIWQLGAYSKRLQKVKIKEIKTQAIMFYTATSGLGGVQFKGIKTPGDYWRIDEPEIRQTMKMSDESEVNAVIKLFGG